MARQKTRSKKDEDILFLQAMLSNNTKAVKEGPRKKFSKHDIRHIKPLTYGQRQLFESYFAGSTIVANGSAGTGKTFCALYLALSDVLCAKTPQTEVIIIRSVVPTREMGHLPGDINDKMAPYEEPYKDIVSSLLGKSNAYDVLKDSKALRFMSTSFIRGLTWDNAVIIIDEIQSMNFHEINSVITRLGTNSKLIICGDTKQNDLFNKRNDETGYPRALRALGKMRDVDIITFVREDIVRSKFVKDWICAVEDEE